MKEKYPEHEERHGHHVHEHSHIEGYTHTHEHSHDVPHEHHGSSPGKAILTVKGVDFEYLSDPVLQDTTVGVARGEILAILGPNGVGKFTLLKCMNLTDPETKDRSNSSGRDGSNKDVRHRDCTKRGICCPQRNESTRMTVFYTVLLGRKSRISAER